MQPAVGMRFARRRPFDCGALLLVIAFVISELPRVVRAQAIGPFAEGALSGWRLSGGVGEDWESNVRFARPDGESDLTTRARVEGARLWRTRRDVVAVAAAGSFLRYRTLTDLNRSTHDLSLDMTHNFTHRTSAGIDLRTRSELTNRSLTPSGDGSLLNELVSQRSWIASGSLSYQLSRVVTTRVGGNVTDISFDTPGRVGGQLVNIGADVTRRLSRAHALALGYDYRHSNAAKSPLDAHLLTATSLNQLTRRVSTRLTTSVVLTEQAAGPLQARFVGGGALTLQGNRDHLSAEYQRSVGQEFGRESATEFTTDLLGLTYNRIFRRGFQLDSRARQAWSFASRERGRSTRSTEGAVNVRYVMRSGPALVLGAFLLRRDDQSVVTSHGLTIGVGYGWSQIRAIPAPNQPETR